MKIIVRYGKFDIRFCIPCSEDLISVFNDCQSLNVCFIERKIDFFFNFQSVIETTYYVHLWHLCRTQEDQQVIWVSQWTVYLHVFLKILRFLRILLKRQICTTLSFTQLLTFTLQLQNHVCLFFSDTRSVWRNYLLLFFNRLNWIDFRNRFKAVFRSMTVTRLTACTARNYYQSIHLAIRLIEASRRLLPFNCRRSIMLLSWLSQFISLYWNAYMCAAETI